MARFKEPPCGVRVKSSEAREIVCNACRICAVYMRASGVICMRLALRKIKLTPNWASSACNCRLTALWVWDSSLATALALPKRSSASSALKDAIEGKNREGAFIYSIYSYYYANLLILCLRNMIYRYIQRQVAVTVSVRGVPDAQRYAPPERQGCARSWFF